MGADYRKPNSEQLGFSTGSTTVPVAQTRYMGLGYAFNGAAAAHRNIQFTGTIDHLRALATAAPGVGETFTYTVFINGNVTAITCQTAGAVAVESDDLVNAVAVVPGDDICIRIETSAGAAVLAHNATVRFRH